MGVKIGYARCSQDRLRPLLHRQTGPGSEPADLLDLGVPDDRIYLDRAYSGSNRMRPGLDQALAAVRPGDTLVVPKLDRLARVGARCPRHR